MSKRSSLILSSSINSLFPSNTFLVSSSEKYIDFILDEKATQFKDSFYNSNWNKITGSTFTPLTLKEQIGLLFSSKSQFHLNNNDLSNINQYVSNLLKTSDTTQTSNSNSSNTVNSNITQTSNSNSSNTVNSNTINTINSNSSNTVNSNTTNTINPLITIDTVTYSEALHLFSNNPFKLLKLSTYPKTQPIKIYKHNDTIDIESYGEYNSIYSIEGTKLSTSSFESYHKISRINYNTFNTPKQKREYELFIAECCKRDHRVIGKTQDIFMMHPSSPGCIFMLPHGMRIKNKLIGMLNEYYNKSNYQIVESPLLFEKSVWETSGHWQNYKDDMFLMDGQGLKPMNCPSHCLIFMNRRVSYKELPVRLAEFTALHRNESTGGLTGLTRLRLFHQDDAHIFCTFNQIESEIENTLKMIDEVDSLKMIDEVYEKLGFDDVQFALSTRPASFIGDLESWNKAEDILKRVLSSRTKNLVIKEGDGAFYGPKIDVMVKDAMKRSHQLGTVQLDFHLPDRFNLKYTNEQNQPTKPVLIHRAVLGSIERMMGILIEHHSGKWPMWLNPRQILIIPTLNTSLEYAETIKLLLSKNGMFCDLDSSDSTISKKIREAYNLSYNYVIVVGDKEIQSHSVQVRDRSGKNFEVQFDELIDYFQNQVEESKGIQSKVVKKNVIKHKE